MTDTEIIRLLPIGLVLAYIFLVLGYQFLRGGP